MPIFVLPVAESLEEGNIYLVPAAGHLPTWN